MRSFSIGRVLTVALLGLAVALAGIAGLGVAGLYDARQEYEDRLSAAYELENAASNVLAAAVIEEAVLRTARGSRARTVRARAERAFEAAIAAAREAAADDPQSAELVEALVAAQARGRAAGGAAQLRAARQRVGQLAARQRERRADARDQTGDDTRDATVTIAVAGGVALLAAMALAFALVGSLRRPLEALVRATRRVAGGDLRRRVPPAGPRELRELGEAFNQMASDLEHAQARVEAERARLAITIESLGDALLVTDDGGRITMRNARAAQLLPSFAIGEPIGPPLPTLDDALAGEVVVESETGATLAVTASPVGGEEAGVVWTVRDTSERARLERLKTEFVATASHELRSPLTSIKGFVELLSRSPGLDERQREFIDIVLLSTNRLVDLVNDLLDVARIEAGRFTLERRSVAVDDAIREVATLMRPRISEKDQELELEVAPDLPPAYGDAGRVRQILTNLVTNAHLYTPQGGHLRIAAHAEDDFVRIDVSDDGPGIAPTELELVFERFSRGETASAPGTGLGLSIVKSLVDLHGGSIAVDSAPGKGTTFTVCLPLAVDRDVEALRRALRGRRVLVIDDEPEVAALISRQLEPYGVDVVTADSGEAALELLRAQAFDAITLDMVMPGMSGFEVLRAIRREPELERLPVVVVSVLAGREVLAGEWKVAKPIDPEELADKLGSAVLAGRTRVLVVARAALRGKLDQALDTLGLEHEWASSAAAAARLCGERRFEVALVDAGLRSPQAALEAIQLRGRRVRRAVVVFSDGDDVTGLAELGGEPVPLEQAGAAVLDALGAPPDSGG